MQTFIEFLVEEVNKTYSNISKECVFILPSKRAALFLKKALSLHSKTIMLSPEIHSIEEFIENISGLTTANGTTQIFELYTAYQKVGDYEKESFDSFLKWGQTLLQDFNEIDRYLVDSSQLYQNIAAIQEINHWSLAAEKTEMIENYIHFWQHLESIYLEFNRSLLEKKLGHQGLIYRTAVASLPTYVKTNKKSHLFVGFNALNKSEIQIIQHILAETNSDIYWDLDKYFLEDEIHDAGYFLREYQKSWTYLKKQSTKGISAEYLKTKNIEVIGVPKNISQVNYVGNLVSELVKNNPNSLQNTAIVLGNETLLNPLLNAIPEHITTVNVTMGQKLEATTLASFFLNLIEFHESKTNKGWFYTSLLHLLTHSYTILLFQDIGVSVDQLVKTIKTNNWSYITLEQIGKLVPELIENELQLFDSANTNPQKLLKNFSSLIMRFKKMASISENNLLLEQLYKFHSVFNQLELLCSQYSYIKNLKGLNPLYQQLISSESLDFQGNPVDGIQIMGMLESRLLDFETVIITSVNEGILPSGKSNNSFLPFDLKNKHGLPTYKEKDAVYTYHFYRLIQRAKNVYIIYNTEPDVLEGGERSRLITQLLTDENRKDITEFIATPKIKNHIEDKECIIKTPSLVSLIMNKSARGFSPSSLSNYIRNPINFYKQNLLNINDIMEVEETLAANTFGTIVHDSLEEIYTPFIGTFLTPQNLEKAKKSIEPIVKRNYTKSFKEGNISTGKNYLSFHVILKYIQLFIDAEIANLKDHQIKIIGLEANLHITLDVPGVKDPVILKGKLDRIEEYDGITRIIDYKTGKVERKNVELIDWDVLTQDYQYSKAFQLLCYALMFQKSNPSKEANIQAGIISLKNFKDGTLLFAKKESARGQKNYLIDAEILMAFEQQLYSLISEIQNTDIPFLEKEV